MTNEFDWNDEKAAINRSKHDVSFDEATTIFNDFGLILVPDNEHSSDEEREIAIGYSQQRRLLSVCFTERGSIIRIISARKSTPSERKLYENNR
jgi:uncharacterized protein